MFRIVPYFTISALVAFFSLGAQHAGTPAAPPVGHGIADWTWNSECGSGGCSQEEISEDWEDYSEECMQSTCSQEELSELAGGTAAINPMLQNYLSNARVVMQASFQGNPTPPGDQVWWYTGCPSTGANPTGMVVAQGSNWSSMANAPTSRNNSPSYINFNNNAAAFLMGSSYSTVTIYTAGNYGGTSYASSTSIPCLAQTVPSFANNVQSASLTGASAAAQQRVKP